MPAAVEAMASTPNSQGAMDSASAADKKRNKLGYHRTSVACDCDSYAQGSLQLSLYKCLIVHCRRRKIRCLVAPDDVQGRCENCIRLRKECQFFPVDQQPAVEKKSRPSSRLETGSADHSTTPISSSPTNINTDSVEAYYPYPQVPLSASSGQEMAAFNPAFGGGPMTGFAPGRLSSLQDDRMGTYGSSFSLPPASPVDRSMGPGEFTGHPAMETGVPWDEFTTISDPQMLASIAASKGQMMNLAPNVWNPAVPAGLSPSSPIAGAPPMTGQGQPMNPGPAYTMQPDGTVWQVPPQPSRAMSYPGQTDMSASYPSQFQAPMAPDLKRRMTTPAAGSQGSPIPSPDMQTPGAVPFQPQANMGFTQWPPMNAMSGMSVVPYPMYSGDVQQPLYTTNAPPMGHPGAPGRSGP
ncbi:hypothetical protein N7462_001137 [Penicillium macrosclerotiorum]|uniref:uncharacterized protein n=1 Tax=Penicillium macrosclerotiorum TaxID=303699 RepID=UPI0025481933|nr:uncharacterized protein N7462_001137 [Penicillium macrosclerotiorum]KAJ5699132.1 hypothetical protein N7462_001137 [Penicillium macrosclerotiorum]